MAATLLLVFRSRLRLLPLAIALAAAALVFGLSGLLGGSLTMASIAALPILIGLAVDYAIQFQARFDEALGATGRRGQSPAAKQSKRRARTAGGPTIGAACLATAAGILALQLSPTPMVRSFGLLLLIGIGLAFLLALTAGFAALSLRRRPRGERSSAGWHGGRVRERRRSPRPQDPPPVTGPARRSRLLSLALSHPKRVLGVSLALAVIGWGLGTQIETVSDVRSLAPQNLAPSKTSTTSRTPPASPASSTSASRPPT